MIAPTCWTGLSCTRGIAVQRSPSRVPRGLRGTCPQLFYYDDNRIQRLTPRRLELLERIERVLDEQVRPDLRADGGDIVVVGIDPDNIVQVRLTGACQGCSSSIVTMSMRVEATLKAHVPEIRFVEAVP